MQVVMSKARKHQVSIPTEYLVDVTPGKSIKIYKDPTNARAYGVNAQAAVKGQEPIKGASFEVGDIAEYDSFNLHYTGTIVSITANTVTIAEKYNNGRKHRLDLYTFCWRNFNFDAVRIAAEDSETMMHI